MIAWESSCGGRAESDDDDDEEDALGFAGRIGGVISGLGF